MAKRQTRRSVSIKGLTYQRLKDWCDENGRSVSGYLEDLIAADMTAEGAPVPTVLRPRPAREETPEPATPKEFTF